MKRKKPAGTSSHGAGSGASNISHLAMPREVGRVSTACIKYGVFGFPFQLGRAFIVDSALESPLSESRVLDLFGENLIRLFDELGPIYGKVGQTVLSRLSPPMHDLARALRLTRLYKDWPPLPFAEVTTILDREIPHWRGELKVEPHPIGVASLAQVHGAMDRQGGEWVIKIIKPQAKKRLLESVQSLDQLIHYLEPFAVTHVARRGLRELRELCLGFRRELSLSRERETIARVRDKMAARRQRILVIPQVVDEFCTDNVLVIQRFRGTPLADLVEGKVSLPSGMRQKLARKMLQELLVQVFELGLFHADPHAGNLILLDDGAVGLYDWGLTGELLESDRRHIAAILKAVIALDQEKLIDAIMTMAEESNRKVTRPQVRKELTAVIHLIKKGKQQGQQKKPSLQQLFEACLKGASRLGVTIPEGLVLMVKSLITVEGLAKGIDPKVSLTRVATPVLFRAARPSIKDMVAIGRRFPKLARQVLMG